MERPSSASVSFGGRSEFTATTRCDARPLVDTRDVLRSHTTHRFPGFRNGTVNTLRLWQAASTDEFDLEEFNAGSYTEAVESKTRKYHHDPLSQ